MPRGPSPCDAPRRAPALRRLTAASTLSGPSPRTGAPGPVHVLAIERSATRSLEQGKGVRHPVRVSSSTVRRACSSGVIQCARSALEALQRAARLQLWLQPGLQLPCPQGRPETRVEVPAPGARVLLDLADDPAVQ